MSTVLVTGASGNVGSHVAALLAEKGVPVRRGSRSAANGAGSIDDSVVALDFLEPSTFGPALDGVDRVFLVRPPHLSDSRDIHPFIHAITHAGVRHVVFLSVQGAGLNPFVPHTGIEHSLRRSGVTWTFLRPSFFMQNLTTTHRADICQRDEIFVPAGRGRTNFIDALDVAEAAVAVLTGIGHDRKAYEITGPEAMTYADVATVLSEASGRAIEYRAPSAAEFTTRMSEAGHDAAFISVMLSIYRLAKFGLAAGTSGVLETLICRPPTSMAQFAARERALLQPSSPLGSRQL